MDATFYTIADSRYFVGAVALLNSLRVVGHEEPVVVLDTGMTTEQRALLEPAARVVSLPAADARRPYLSKAFAHAVGAAGVALVVDSDILVTRRLDDVVAAAAAGGICVFAEHREARGRWFAEWSETLGLRAPLRRQTFVNSGFVAVSTEVRPALLARWWEACALVPRDQLFGPSMDAPFWTGDMDVLNALLMSELPADATTLLPEDDVVWFDELRDVDVVDAATLDVRRRPAGTRPAILHYSFAPKPWERSAWLRVRRDAFVRLLSRLLVADDVAVRLEPGSVPVWLRPGSAGRASLAALDAAHGVARRTAFALPAPARQRLVRARNAVFGRLRA